MMMDRIEPWRRVRSWLAEHAPEHHATLRRPAHDEEIRSLAARAGDIPIELETLLRENDGQSEGWGVLGGDLLLSANGIAHAMEQIRAVLTGPGGEYAWSAEWIAFAADGGGRWVMIDRSDGAVLRGDLVSASRVASSLGELLERYADELEAGVWVASTDDDGDDILEHRDGRWIGEVPLEAPSTAGGLLDRLVRETRRDATEDELARLAADPIATLAAAESSMTSSKEWGVRDAYLRLVARALGPAAAAWVRRHAEDRDLSKGAVVDAIVASWDPARGLSDAVAEHERLGDSKIFLAVAGPELVSWIDGQTPETLKKIDPAVITASRPQWSLLERWLERGRPWSHTALDVIVSGLTTGTPGMSNPSRRLTPAERLLEGVPSDQEVCAKLEELAAKDDVPRVTKAVRHVQRALGGRR